MPERPTSASLLSGGKFADIGLMEAGFEPIWGIEMDPAIAEVASANVPGVTLRARVEDVDYRRLEAPDLLWASPECKEFSAAKTGGKEGPIQRAQADAICAALETLRPPLFVLENVVGYRRSDYSLPKICATLARLGYIFDLRNVNAADYGVPQTRRRLILRAARDLLIPLVGRVRRSRWVGWYAAIEDLLPTLPESAFAPWQLARLEPLFGDTLVHLTADNPRFPVRDANDPSFVIGAGGSLPRGYLLDSSNTGQEWGKKYRGSEEPAFTQRIVTRPNSHMSPNELRMRRAFLIGGGNTQLADPSSHPRDEGDPAFTVAGNDSATTNQRAFIVDDQHGGQLRGEDGRGLTIRQAADPVFTVQAGSNKPARAWLDQGRVVAMTPRALARFQSVPDSYQLPESRGLACKVIGNGVPCLLAQRVGESLRGLLP